VSILKDRGESSLHGQGRTDVQGVLERRKVAWE
jgi:hypothetical protein